MSLWKQVVQNMIDYLEERIGQEVSLLDMASAVGYSPTYCSSQFHKVVGVTMRSYLANRRLSLAALELRDSKKPILDIAFDYGFTSQEAFTRAFSNLYNCTPKQYRMNPKPIVMPIRQTVVFPSDIVELDKGEIPVSVLTQARVRVEFIPDHSFIGVYDTETDNYMDFMGNRDCEYVTGMVDSMSHVADKVVRAHTAGWSKKDGKDEYFYGFGVPSNYAGEIPRGFERREVKGTYYVVYYHPVFDFQKDCATVMERVENLAKSFDPKEMGFTYTKGPVYQRHFPEELGYEILRPVIPIEK